MLCAFRRKKEQDRIQKNVVMKAVKKKNKTVLVASSSSASSTDISAAITSAVRNEMNDSTLDIDRFYKSIGWLANLGPQSLEEKFLESSTYDVLHSNAEDADTSSILSTSSLSDMKRKSKRSRKELSSSSSLSTSSSGGQFAFAPTPFVSKLIDNHACY